MSRGWTGGTRSEDENWQRQWAGQAWQGQGWRTLSSGGSGAPAQSSGAGGGGAPAQGTWSSGWSSAGGSWRDRGYQSSSRAPGQAARGGQRRNDERTDAEKNQAAYGRVDPVLGDDDSRYLIRLRWPGHFFRTLPNKGQPGDLDSLKAAAADLETEIHFRVRTNRLSVRAGGRGSLASRDPASGNTGGWRGNFLTVIGQDVDCCREIVLMAIRVAETVPANSAAVIRKLRQSFLYEGPAQEAPQKSAGISVGAPTGQLAFNADPVGNLPSDRDSDADPTDDDDDNRSSASHGADLPDQGADVIPEPLGSAAGPPLPPTSESPPPQPPAPQPPAPPVPAAAGPTAGSHPAAERLQAPPAPPAPAAARTLPPPARPAPSAASSDVAAAGLDVAAAGPAEEPLTPPPRTSPPPAWPATAAAQATACSQPAAEGSQVPLAAAVTTQRRQQLDFATVVRGLVHELAAVNAEGDRMARHADTILDAWQRNPESCDAESPEAAAFLSKQPLLRMAICVNCLRRDDQLKLALPFLCLFLAGFRSVRSLSFPAVRTSITHRSW